MTMEAHGTKVSVLNNSRQLDKLINGEWVTIKVLPEASLPKGVYRLANAEQPALSPAPIVYRGPILLVDDRKVYQLHGKCIVQHDRAMFRRAEVGNLVSVKYQHGQGSIVRND